MIIYIYDAELPHTCCSGHGLMRLLCAVLRLMRSFLMMHAYLAGEGYRGRGYAAYKPERAHAIDLLLYHHHHHHAALLGGMFGSHLQAQVQCISFGLHSSLSSTMHAFLLSKPSKERKSYSMHHNDDMYACPSRSSLHILILSWGLEMMNLLDNRLVSFCFFASPRVTMLNNNPSQKYSEEY